MEHAATRAERRQEAATQSQPEFDSLAVGLPAQGWLAKPAAPETERLAAGTFAPQAAVGRRREAQAQRQSEFDSQAACVFDLD